MPHLFEILRHYFEGGFLCAVAWGTWRLARVSGMSRAAALRWGQALLLLSLVLPFAPTIFPDCRLFRPAAQIWSGGTKAGSEPFALVTSRVSEPAAVGVRIERRSLLVVIALFAAGALLSLLRLASRVRALRAILAGCVPFRTIGRVKVLVGDDIDVPFSAWWTDGAYVILPAGLGPENFVLAARHELRHHRQGDTRAVYFLEILKSFYFWQPAAWAWARDLSRAQELAVDEHLVHRRGVPARRYGELLLAVAVGRAPDIALAMASARGGSFLRRRVAACLAPGRRRGGALVGSVALLALVGSATLARGAIRDRSVGIAEARRLAADISFDGMPVDVNDLVVARLNHYVGTPEGRRYLRRALARLPRYRAMIERALDHYGLPRALVALPFIESGFFNGYPVTAHGAGIWQFIVPTARRYDLVVGKGRDDRLDEEKETVAAMRYLRDLHRQFGDWRLAVKGYNEGERAVASLIRRVGTRDPWRLERASSRDKYLASAVAAILILHHPELLD